MDIVNTTITRRGVDMSEKYKHLEGAVPVNGDITPITRQPIDQINAASWEDMPFEALEQQYNMLVKRINLVKTMGRTDLSAQMERGLKYLTQLIETKRPKNDGVTLL